MFFSCFLHVWFDFLHSEVNNNKINITLLTVTYDWFNKTNLIMCYVKQNKYFYIEDTNSKPKIKTFLNYLKVNRNFIMQLIFINLKLSFCKLKQTKK